MQKRSIREAFGRAAPAYDSVAHVQRRIADALLEKCVPRTGIAVDAGSGTGYGHEKLRALGLSCIALDHAAPMLRQSNVPGICGDIEALPLGTASISLYYSSLAWQWTDVSCASAEAARVLRDDGMLAIATLGPDTLRELREAFRQADDREHVRQFVPVEYYAPQLARAGFNAIEIQTIPFVAHAADFRSMLHDIKTLGAHVIDSRRPRGLFGVQGFRRAESHYEQRRDERGLPLTYEAVFITARRKQRSA